MNSLFATIVDAGLASRANQLTSLALPCIRLLSRHASTPSASGPARLGGLPDVPTAFEWPVWRDLPLAFICQIDLATVARHLPAVLPHSGVLSFFYHPEQMAWGFDPADQGSARVYWFPHLHELRPARPPASLPEGGRFSSVPLQLRLHISLPPAESLDIQALCLSSDEMDAYYDLLDSWEALDEEEPDHQLLGHPVPIQDEMQTECQLVTNGIYCGVPEGYHDPRARELALGASDWRLLAQFASDESADMMWGDAGKLYFWMRRQDVAAGHFDRAWMIFQCS